TRTAAEIAVVLPEAAGIGSPFKGFTVAESIEGSGQGGWFSVERALVTGKRTESNPKNTPGSVSWNLALKSPGFSIPANATIVGVEVVIPWARWPSGPIKRRLYKD